MRSEEKRETGNRQVSREQAAQADSVAGRCLHQFFEEQVETSPDATALSFNGQTLSCAELNRRANRLAHHLLSLGVGPDVLVGLSVERSLEMVVGLLGILKAGGAYVPLDPSYPKQRLMRMLSDAEVPVLVTEQQLLPSVTEHPSKKVCLDRDWETIEQSSCDNPKVSVVPDNLLYLIYTSGSTGEPKGVMVTHDNVVRLFGAMRELIEFDATDVWTLFHSYSFGFSVWELWGALAHGGRLVIVPSEVSRSPEAFYDLLQREHVTVLSQTPSAFRQLLLADAIAAAGADLSLRLIVFSGEAIAAQDVKSWMERHGDQRPQLINTYAITETGGQIAVRRLTWAEVNQSSANLLGRCLPDMQVRVFDEEMNPVPAGATGEFYIAGAGLARGYFKQPALTAERFIPDPHSPTPGARLYKTGDRARSHPSGEVEYLGRSDDQIKIRGFRVEPGEIEAALRTHPAIRDVAVIARGDGVEEKRLVAYVVPRDAAPTRHSQSQSLELSQANVRDYLVERLPDYMVPSAFVVLDALPRSANGKLDRQALPAPDMARREWQSGFVAPRTPVEEVVAQIWAEVLELEKVGIGDDFFELGGHSLLATQIISEVRHRFQVEVSMRNLFEAPTVEGLAKAIVQSQAEKVDKEEMARLLAAVDGLSDEEAERLLTDEIRRMDAEAAHLVNDGRLTKRITISDQTFMRQAIDKARDGIGRGQPPMAACIVKDGEIITCVHNTIWESKDPTAHAEMQAIREACRKLGAVNLVGCVIYSTCEPCPMCFSACYWARISKIIYGARIEDAKRFGLEGLAISSSIMKQLANSSIELIGDVLREENVHLFEVWREGRTPALKR